MTELVDRSAEVTSFDFRVRTADAKRASTEVKTIPISNLDVIPFWKQKQDTSMRKMSASTLTSIGVGN
jgi:hypothetical protein